MINYKLICFDIDETLADRDSTELYPEVVKWLESFIEDFEVGIRRADAPDFALITNQGGPACYDAGWGDKYPSLDKVQARLKALYENVTHAALASPLIYIAWGYKMRSGEIIYPGGIKDFEKRPDFRKPEPGMILRAMEFKRVAAHDTLMVGDRQEDEQAARAAGVDFMWADEFFGRGPG